MLLAAPNVLILLIVGKKLNKQDCPWVTIYKKSISKPNHPISHRQGTKDDKSGPKAPFKQ